jgi:hypothetical protein
METFTINVEDTTPQNETDSIPEQPIKRRRGRPPKSVSGMTVTNGEQKPPSARGRRSSKLTGHDVEALIGQGFSLVAILTKRPYWAVTKEEISPWSSEAAEILNGIPSKYLKMFADSSAYFTVGFGLFSILKPRLGMDAAIAQKIRQQKQKPANQPDISRKESISTETVQESCDYDEVA